MTLRTCDLLFTLVKPLLKLLPPEAAHNVTLKALAFYPLKPAPIRSEALRTHLFGLHFENPLGLAAGFDKNAEALRGISGLGFGFIEAGSVTPKPQQGNPKPRVFRIAEHKAVINRMGFPNAGLYTFKHNVAQYLSRFPQSPVRLGLNIGMNKEQTEPEQDYRLLIESLSPFADYITINISSPNTPGLRNLQAPENLAPFLKKIMEVKPDNLPILVKLAPDLAEEELKAILDVLMAEQVSGVIISNTTLDRPAYLPANVASEKGGLSGSPVKEKSTRAIYTAYAHTQGKLPIIGLGGITSGRDAYEKIRAGASLLQIYTGLVYGGPALIFSVLEELETLLKHDGYINIREAVGAAHKQA